MATSINKKIPKLWIDSLDLDPLSISQMMRLDKKLMYQFALKTYKKSNRRKSLIKDNFIDIFLYEFLKRKNITIKLINNMILNYHKNKKKVEYNYNELMEELDKLIWKDTKIIKNYCNCNKGDLFCFCIDNKGEFIK